MTHIRHSIRVAPLACAVAALMLAACSSGGSGSGSSPNPSPNDTTGVTPVGKVANGTCICSGKYTGTFCELQPGEVPSDDSGLGLGWWILIILAILACCCVCAMCASICKDLKGFRFIH